MIEPIEVPPPPSTKRLKNIEERIEKMLMEIERKREKLLEFFSDFCIELIE